MESLSLAETRPETPPPWSARRLRVLVAEDNTINQKIVILALGKLGHTGTLVTTGEQVLRCLGQQRFDLVLMDDHMPVMTGVQALKALRLGEAPGGAHTPVIIVTANDLPGDREDYLRQGASGYLAKPVRADALQAEMHRVLACQGGLPNAHATSPAGNALPNHGLSADRVRRPTSTMVPFLNLPSRTERLP